MTNLNKALSYLFSLAMAMASVVGFAWTAGLMASRHVNGLEGILLLNVSLLAALAFPFRAQETGDRWPLSIMRAEPVATREILPARFFLRRSEA